MQKDQIQNLEQLLELFLQRYTVQAVKLWQILFQTLLDFVDKISVQANQLHLNTDIIFKIVLNGLSPEIRSWCPDNSSRTIRRWTIRRDNLLRTIRRKI